MTEGTFTDYRTALVYATSRGLELDPQDDYCDICDAYHVGTTHDQAVPASDQCGQVELQGFNTVLECRRHQHHDGTHSNGTSSWGNPDTHHHEVPC